MKPSVIKSWPAFAIPLAISMLTCIPLAMHAWFSSHELCAPIMRLHEMHYVMTQNHRLSAPWLPDFAFGHGFPFFVYYAPLATYVAESVHLLGVNLLDSAKISFGLSLVLSAVSMSALLLYLSRRYGLAAGSATIAVAAAVYVIAPYRMVDVYVRGSIAECWSFVFFPLILLGCHMTAAGDRRRGVPLGAAAYAALIISHNIMAVYFSVAICVYVLLVAETRRIRVLPWIACIIVLGQALSAFFWVPAMANMPLVGTDAATMWATSDDVASHAVYWQQFFTQKWGFGLSVPGTDDGMSFAIGWPIVVACLLLPAVAADRSEHRAVRRMACVLIVMVAALMFAMTHMMPWRIVPALFRYIQFPWRLLALVTLFGSMGVFFAMRAVLRWAGLAESAGAVRSVFLGTVVLLVLMVGAPTIRCMPIDLGTVDRDYILERVRLEEREHIIGTTARAEYIPRTAAPYTLDPEWNKLHNTESHVAIANGTGRVVRWSRHGADYTVELECKTSVTCVFQSYFFPGWMFWMDGTRRDAAIRLGDEGFIHVTVPAGVHTLRFAYGSPPWSRLSQLVSITALAGMAIWLWIGQAFCVPSTSAMTADISLKT
ncbi:MAG: hypothetical protein J7M12_06305 [Candidatus Hydrogenedentes bacterium]|nr:hypothetical protein [Candidatus Hydrogenedentota bacterium]